ncbi:MAG TPA: DUF4142 domain-containing protein [Phycisphaerales bacterium]|nr:DUF4142 domain-containing protein [Phycisphaerales bacterium]
MKMRVLLLVASAGFAVVGCDRNRDDDRYDRGVEYRSTDRTNTTFRNNTTNNNMRNDTAIRSDYRDNTTFRSDTNRTDTNMRTDNRTNINTTNRNDVNWQQNDQNRQQFGSQNQGNNNQAIRAIDKDFVTTAAASGMKEVELGRLGTRQASNEQLKQFAQKIIDDHTKANEELMTLARNKNIDVPTQLPQDHKSMVQKFNQLNGAEFDREFVTHMVQSHQKSVDLFDRQARQGEDAQVRAFAARTLPTLRQHLQMAKDLQQNLTGSDMGTPRRDPNTTPGTTPGNNNPNQPSQPINPLNPNDPMRPSNPSTPPTDPNNPDRPTTPPGGGR